jgi:Secretion system C-terminal sorting domain
MKKLYILFVIYFSAFALNAQTVAPHVLAATGGYSTLPGGSISYTVGEMTMVQTFTGGNNILTQGFQQPNDITLGILDLTQDAFGSFVIYPNPAVDAAWYAYQFPEQGEINVTLYNSLGQKLAEVYHSHYSGGKQIEQLNSSALASGMYYLTLNFVSTQTGAGHTVSKKFQVIK